MKKLIAILAALGLICSQAQSASIITRGANSTYSYGFMANKKVVSSYIGPGNVASGATVWYGLRAYNASYATASGKAVNLRRASDNTTCDFDVNFSGALGNSDGGCSLGGGLSLAAFATTDATCTGTAAASTTLTVTGCSTTPHVGSTITGLGFTQPVFATAVSVSAGSGTITMNKAQTVTSVATTLTYGLYIATFYDQTGNGINATASGTAQPELLPNCVGTSQSLPCAYFNGSSTYMTGTFGTAPVYPVSLIGVVERPSPPVGFGIVIGFGSTSIPRIYFDNGGFAHSIEIYPGVAAGATRNTNATDGVAHAILGTITSSIITLDVDNTSVSATTSGLTNPSTTLSMGADPGNSNVLIGYIGEFGLWPSDQTGNSTSFCHNQYLYWATAVSC